VVAAGVGSQPNPTSGVPLFATELLVLFYIEILSLSHLVHLFHHNFHHL
jgi:hypothetical protein